MYMYTLSITTESCLARTHPMLYFIPPPPRQPCLEATTLSHSLPTPLYSQRRSNLYDPTVLLTSNLRQLRQQWPLQLYNHIGNFVQVYIQVQYMYVFLITGS